MWVRVDGYEKVIAISNEDLERSTGEKTSAVHFMRFELSAEMIAALRSGAGLAFCTDNAEYLHETDVSAETREALLGDMA